jgi:hypothetical protein
MSDREASHGQWADGMNMPRTAFNPRRVTILWKNLPSKVAGGKLLFRLAAGGGRCWQIYFPLLLALLGGGCGFHYYDQRTGVEHVWGFGHLQMRVQPPTNGVQAVIKGYAVVGAKIGGSPDDYGLSLGYDSRRMIYLSPLDAQFGLQWPDANFFNVRVGTNLPPDFNCSFTNQPRNPNGVKIP